MWASGGVSVNVIGLPVATLSGKKSFTSQMANISIELKRNNDSPHV
jgi:hypothetical protein